MTPQELKNAILTFAAKGLITTQESSSNENAADLLLTIKKEKIAKGLKNKNLSKLKEDDIPYEIPSNWLWAKMGDIFEITMGQSPDGKTVSFDSNGMEFHQGKVFFGKTFLQQSNVTTSSPTRIASPGSILLCVRAPVGKVNITQRRICLGRGLCGITCLAGMDPLFVYYFLSTFEVSFNKQATGTTFVAIGRDVILNQPFPLPPLDEQRRIVAKIEKLMPLVDEYERVYNRLKSLNQTFPTDLEKAILLFAMQGRLTTQSKADGDARELLAKLHINPKVKPADPPFDIPDNWMWVAIGNLGETIDSDSFSDGPFGSNLKVEHQTLNKEVRIIQLRNCHKITISSLAE